MVEDKLPEEIRNLLRASYFTYLCTVDGENNPHVTPMFFVYNEELNLIYLISSLKSRKLRNILRNNNVFLTIDARDPTNPFENIGIMIEGRAHLEAKMKIIKSPSNRIFLKKSAIKALKMLEKKYPFLREGKLRSERSTNLLKKFSEVLISIRPRKIVCWIGGPKFKRVEY